MKRYVIFGERSKIGQYLKKYMPKGFKQIPESIAHDYVDRIDVIFLATDSKKAKRLIKKYQSSTQIIDLSGSQKLDSYVGLKKQKYDDFNFCYGFKKITQPGTHKHIANPGCSAIGSLTALFPIKQHLHKEVFIDVKFSKSAMRYSSNNQDVIDDNIKLVHPLSYFQQHELKYVLGNELSVALAANIVGVNRGISLNVFATVKKPVDLAKILTQYYKKDSNIIISKNPIDLWQAIDTNKIFICVKQQNNIVLINVVFDNLIYGGAYNAIQYVTSST